MIGPLILVAYAAVLSGLVLYSLHRGWLLLTYRRATRNSKRNDEWLGPLPAVTVQLPVYNERHVIERLIDAVCRLDYPSELLEIQVLDDSDDDTTDLARRCVARHAARGVRVEHLRRRERTGYKAGALAFGMARAKGEFVVVLDADFVPPADLVRKLLPPLADPSVGMVQARWGHLNESASWLTRAQALILDAHFFIEHGARAAAGLFFNFNGSAGMWRASCLHDAGGWQADTLTEDLDLSYRAQMRGWRFVFLTQVVVPGELPESVRAFKSQQERWAQGAIQTARKLLPELIRSDWGWRIKLEAMAHLTAYVPSLLTLALAVLIFPAAVVRLKHGWPLLLAADLVFFAAAFGPLGYFFTETLRAAGHRAWPAVLVLVPLILALGIGLSINNSRALIAGLFGRAPAEFVRTPKRGGSKRGYRARTCGWGTAAEAALAAYVMVAVGFALVKGLYFSIPFLLLFLYGFAIIAAGSVEATVRRREMPVQS